jgi:hypothetical protein
MIRVRFRCRMQDQRVVRLYRLIRRVEVLIPQAR